MDWNRAAAERPGGANSTDTYKLVAKDPHTGIALGIRCLQCGRISYNSNDVASLYCGYCGKFHRRSPTDGDEASELVLA